MSAPQRPKPRCRARWRWRFPPRQWPDPWRSPRQRSRRRWCPRWRRATARMMRRARRRTPGVSAPGWGISMAGFRLGREGSCSCLEEKVLRFFGKRCGKHASSWYRRYMMVITYGTSKILQTCKIWRHMSFSQGRFSVFNLYFQVRILFNPSPNLGMIDSAPVVGWEIRPPCRTKSLHGLDHLRIRNGWIRACRFAQLKWGFGLENKWCGGFERKISWPFG